MEADMNWVKNEIIAMLERIIQLEYELNMLKQVAASNRVWLLLQKDGHRVFVDIERNM